MLVIVYICQSVSIFFFKQKTAYEMRISDWSSDVCSYDLWRPGVGCRRDLLSVSKYLIRTRTGRALTLAKVIRMVHNKSSQQALTHEPEAPSTHQHQHQHQHAPAVEQPAPGTIYTCPMHPEIRQDHPGSCPKCGMAHEPLIPSLEDDNPELKDFTRRFWWTLPFTIVVTVLAMFGHQLGWFGMTVQSWIELDRKSVV